MLDALISLDQTIFSVLNQNIANPVFDWLMPIITNQNNWTFPILIGLSYLIFTDRKKGLSAVVVLLAVIVMTDVVCAQLIKPLVGRLRPSHAGIENIRLLVGRGGQFGFVSNHAANSFAAAFVLGSFYKMARIPLFVMACIIAFSRIYVGVHYPADVIAGGMVGALFGFFIMKIFLQSRWANYLNNGTYHAAA